MSKSSVRRLVAVLALATGALGAELAYAQTPPAPKLSPSLAKIYRAADDAEKAKHWPDVIARAEEVLGTSARKPDDTYYASYLIYFASRAQSDMAGVQKGLVGMVDSGFLTPEQQAAYLKPLQAMAFQAKDYDAAIDYGTRMTGSETADPEVFSLIGQSYYLKNNFSDAARFYTSLVSEQIKRGQTPREHDLRMLQATEHKLGSKEAETDAIQKLVLYYPKPEYWDALLYSVRNIPTLEPRQKLQVYRLMWATGTLKLATDYNRFADLALGVGLPAEAQSVFEAALKANVFDSDMEKQRAERIRASAEKSANGDKADEQKLDAEAKASATGDLDVALGMDFYSYGQFDKATEALQRGLAKGGVKDELQIEAGLVLGMAQLHSNDKADALKTFKGIKTDDANWQRIAQLWTLYAS